MGTHEVWLEKLGIARSSIVLSQAGLTSAVFSLSQCVTAMFWVRASDRYGRKPVILASLICAMTTTILYGFSQNLTWALIARTLAGASNGNVGIIRTTGLSHLGLADIAGHSARIV